ncbi:ABC transporter permease [Sutcliffiella rhizosphaerae]|uniref:ABC transporter permease n=1 Tax=Sutcliffiella rhizosphaerae TaxID=2880967 RepID=A0ABN8AGG5_9BACI|nr:ABC transporter permease [Sutcliffiella rhizosphaerae]CAG9622148.1 hypothetical protein BACCIP111883_02939 [Sutcliffiella rhizosphaerae]
MSSFQLYWNRLREEYKYQWKNTKAIIDWTILIYLFLFILFIGAMIYDMFPSLVALLQGIPFGLTLFIVYYFAWNGTLRIYYQKADHYFFIHRNDLLKGLKKYGIISSIFITFLKGILVAVTSYLLLNAVAPGLLPWFEWVLYYISIMLFIMILKKIIAMFWLGWKNRAVNIALFVLLGGITYFTINWEIWVPVISMFLIGTLILYLYYWRTDSFMSDVEENEKIRQKYVGMIFSASEYVHIPKASSRTKPLFFRKSERIFQERKPQHALTELFFKYLLRNSRHIFSYLKLIGITIGVMTFIPLWLKFGLFVAFFFFLKEWLNIVYDELVGHPFLDMHKDKKLVKEEYQEMVTRWLYYPALGIVGISLIMNSFVHFLVR